jgi:photosystem II stability/assembly factor-like uncharacterized protein
MRPVALLTQPGLGPAILFMTAALAIQTGRAATWSEINAGLPVTGVEVAKIVVAPSTPSTLYANARRPDGTGAIFKTTDGARSWRDIGSVTGATSVVVDPRSATTIYAVTSRGLLKSTDGGDSWTGVGDGLSSYILALAIDPVTSSTLYAATAAPGIFKSTDGGATWKALDTGIPANTYVGSLAIDPANPSRIFFSASVSQPPGPPAAAIFRSVDGGETWNASGGLTTGAGIASLAISSTAPSVVYALLNGPPAAEILKSGDGGETWNTVSAGLPAGASIRSLAIAPQSSSTLYIAVFFSFAEAGGVLKSTDGGLTWKTVQTGFPANTPIQSVVIDPVSSSILYLIVDQGIYKSADGGTTWTRSSQGLTTIEVQTLATNGTDPATLYIGAGNQIFKTIDGGASWTGLVTFQLSPSGTAFVPSPFPNGSPAYPKAMLIDAVDPGTLYVATNRGNGCYYADNLVFKSTDAGASWTDSVSPDKSGCVVDGSFGRSAGLKAIDPTDPNTVYLAVADDEDGYWALLKTGNGGASWNPLTLPGNGQAGVWALAIDPTNPATLYAGVDDTPYFEGDTIQPGPGGVFKSTDGGMSWSSIGPSGGAVNLLAIDHANPSVLYAAREGNYGVPNGFQGLFKSADGGANWDQIGNGLDGLAAVGAVMTAIVISPADSNVLYAGTAGNGVFKSTDGGANWSQLNDGLTNLDVRGLAVAPGSLHTLYAGTSEGIFKIIDDTL